MDFDETLYDQNVCIQKNRYVNIEVGVTLVPLKVGS